MEKVLNGYEFTRFEADYTSKVKAETYDASTLAWKILYSFPGDYKENADYKDAKFWLYEVTMSCNGDEAVKWMKYFMLNAIAYGIQTKNLDWKTKFLAAYDIFVELTGGGFTGPSTDKMVKFAQVC